jgi:GT2 family glycosyltransferase/glycosyltransferase involved in cell wall biosynthesis
MAETPFVAFLNNDMKVDPGWLLPLLEALENDDTTMAAGSKVLSWDGTKVDFGGADLNFEGRAFQRDFQAYHDPHSYKKEESIFLNGGAMLVRRDAFLKIGGFDEDFFAYYEDVDFGWRAWILGYKLVWVPESVTYHRHGATSARLTAGQKRFLLERNALLSMFKNYDNTNLSRALTSALLLAAKRTLAGSNIARNSFRLSPPSPPQDTIHLHPEAASHIAAITDGIRLLPAMQKKRSLIQSNRKRSDKEVLARFGKPTEPIHPGRAYARTQQRVLEGTGLTTLLSKDKGHVLLISPDILPLAGLPTTGAGLRAWGLGQGLRSHGLSVSFSMPKAALGSYPDVPLDITELAWDERNLAELVTNSGATVVVACGWPLLEQLAECPRPVVLDFHGPHLIERTIQEHLDIETNIRTKLCCINRADFFTCAGDRQRSYFIPWLLMAGIPYGEEMIAQVPVCLDPTLPTKVPPSDDEPVFVYGGVFLPWQDPRLALTILVEELERAGKGRLELFGGRHPFIPLDTRRFETLVKRLDSSVRVVSHGMVDHDELLRAYTRATVAMDVMVRNQERELAFTTRTVEYLWCGLPVIYNDYADLAPLIRDYDAGWTVNPESADEIRAAVRAVLAHPEEVRKKSLNATRLVSEHLTWEKAVEPLVEFCTAPSFRPHSTTSVSSSSAAEISALQRAVYDKDVHIRNLEAMLARKGMFSHTKYLGRRVLYHFRHGGFGAVLSRSVQALRGRFGRNAIR